MPKITASTLPAGVSAQVPIAPDVALRVGGHQAVADQAPVAAGPEQVIPFLKHPCTLPASLAVHWYCLRSAFAFTNALAMASGHGGALQARKGRRAGRKTAVGRPGPGGQPGAGKAGLMTAPSAAAWRSGRSRGLEPRTKSHAN
ncbi:hypothetical protein Veis_1975 [Verminephrobacter eiseniae EF01-2]|uniref:Uncharacterized protein n=1 Tax=Verminephrobacter eiseniae (strain EF01-2) TaxID=391735 RepID=A1WJC0_VEREI|nr:hypothetical protein Veis_1975 [Verminephrobacter eiseniae EF01-2]